jgi:hypothetical protein
MFVIALPLIAALAILNGDWDPLGAIFLALLWLLYVAMFGRRKGERASHVANVMSGDIPHTGPPERSTARLNPQRRSVSKRLDDLNQLLAPIALATSEREELPRSGHDCPALARAGHGDPAATPELEQPLVAQQAQGTEDRVAVHAEHRCQVARRRQALARAPINLDLEYGASDNGSI